MCLCSTSYMKDTATVSLRGLIDSLGGSVNYPLGTNITHFMVFRSTILLSNNTPTKYFFYSCFFLFNTSGFVPASGGEIKDIFFSVKYKFYDVEWGGQNYITFLRIYHSVNCLYKKISYNYATKCNFHRIFNKTND